MAKIYWITGLPNQGKTELATRLHTLLKTERRNWRKSVFHLDEQDFPELSNQDDITYHIQLISEFLVNRGCDVVVSAIAPVRNQRDKFKKSLGESKIEEIYIDSSRPIKRPDFSEEDYYEPEYRFTHIQGDGKSIDDCYNELINKLISENKI